MDTDSRNLQDTVWWVGYNSWKNDLIQILSQLLIKIGCLLWWEYPSLPCQLENSCSSLEPQLDRLLPCEHLLILVPGGDYFLQEGLPLPNAGFSHNTRGTGLQFSASLWNALLDSGLLKGRRCNFIHSFIHSFLTPMSPAPPQPGHRPCN